jgi:E3 SUMO-protein ligase PIAS1
VNRFKMEASREEVGALIRHVKAQLNNTLKSICQQNFLKSTGVKAELQTRIVSLIEGHYNSRNWQQYREVEQTITTIAPLKNTPYVSRATNPGINPASIAARPPPPASNSNGSSSSSTNMPPYLHPLAGALALNFKPSPFYQPITQIGGIRTLEVMREHKNTSSIPIPSSFLQSCVRDSSYRIMVFGAKSTGGAQDIAFPHQADIRVEGAEVKGLNLRGLKNKPGTTRPADVTNALLAKNTSYDRNIEFVYALTNERFYIVAYLCRISSVEELVTKIASGHKISKDSVLREFAEKEQDDDVVATSTVLSLKCPISCVRLSLPCRGIGCKHIQCFDATSYLQLQQQGPQWLCPICNKSTPFDQLAVDEYVRDILVRTSSSTDQVTIEPNGRWGLSLPGGGNKNSNRKRKASSSSDFEEVIISGTSTVGGRQMSYTPHTSNSYATPRPPSREASSAAGAGSVPRSASSKRPVAQVIDLTLSSDEDDEPIARPTKRQNQGYSR